MNKDISGQTYSKESGCSFQLRLWDKVGNIIMIDCENVFPGHVIHHANINSQYVMWEDRG